MSPHLMRHLLNLSRLVEHWISIGRNIQFYVLTWNLILLEKSVLIIAGNDSSVANVDKSRSRKFMQFYWTSFDFTIIFFRQRPITTFALFIIYWRNSIRCGILVRKSQNNIITVEQWFWYYQILRETFKVGKFLTLSKYFHQNNFKKYWNLIIFSPCKEKNYSFAYRWPSTNFTWHWLHNFLFIFFRFCVGDKFYLCDNKILCEYDYEERLVFASMANHPILKRHASGSLPGTPPSLPNIPTSNSSPIQQNGHHHALMSNITSPRSQNNDLNNNQNGLNGVSSPFGTPTHMKQVISSNWNQQNPRWPKWNGWIIRLEFQSPD